MSIEARTRRYIICVCKKTRLNETQIKRVRLRECGAEERVRQSRGSDLHIQGGSRWRRGWGARKAMHVFSARGGEGGGGERESSAWGAMAGV